MSVDASVETVLVMAGGTGGHVFPALAVAGALQDRGVAVQWLGTARGIEARVVPAAGITLHTLPVQGIRGKGLLSRITALVKAMQSLLSAVVLIGRVKPICVIGLGGYVAGPGGLAAWLTRTPLLIHEQNAVPGTTNRLLARFARRILTGYPVALGGDKAVHIGNPVRADISLLPAPETRCAERERLRLLVLGGSQGALAINRAVTQTVAQLPKGLALDVWHQTGAAHIEAMNEAYRNARIDADISIKAEAFIDNMAEAYAWADVVLCRAGALTVAELTAAGVASWLVPLPQAIDDHQRANARWLEEHGAGEILEQSSLSVELLTEKLMGAAKNRGALLQMATAARQLAKPDAAAVAAGYCLEVAHG